MQRIEISYKTIVFTVLFLLGIRFVWEIRDLIFSLLIAFILMSALRPLVMKLKEKKLSHGVAVAITYAAFLFIVIALFSIIIPPIIEETSAFITSFPVIIQKLDPRLSFLVSGLSLGQYLPDATNQVLKFATSFFTNALFIVSTLFFGFYFLLEEKEIIDFITIYVPKHTMQRFTAVFEHVTVRLSSWFWGELTLMTVVGLLNFIGFSLIGIKYALPLAVLAGLLEVVPNIGPTIAALPAFLIGISISNYTGVAALAVAFLVQQLENNLIVPVIMRHAVGLNPIITLIVLVIGGKIGGVLGLLLAIPAFLFVESILLEVLRDRRLTEKLQ
jgi:predicted PurR-regulated permease PerM